MKEGREKEESKNHIVSIESIIFDGSYRPSASKMTRLRENDVQGLTARTLAFSLENRSSHALKRNDDTNFRRSQK